MAWDSGTVLAASGGYSSYTRGVAINKEGNLTIMSDERISFFQYAIQGAVLDGTDTYYCRVYTAKDSFVGNYCTCGKGIKSLCPHQVAISLQWLEKRKPEEDNEIHYTDANFLTMIEKYTEMEDADYRTACTTSDDMLHLLPEFKLDISNIKASFRMGHDKLYVLKDAGELVNAINNHNEMVFSKNFSCIPEENFFSGYDRSALKIIEKRVAAGEYSERYISLHPSDLDSLIIPLEDQTVSVIKTEKAVDYIVTSEDPELKFSIDAKKKNGVTLNVGDSDFRIFKGQKTCYIFLNEKIYICSEDFNRDCADFLETVEALKNRSRNSIDIHKNELKAFFSKVYPRISAHMNLTLENVDPAAYVPKPLKAQFMLDKPTDDSLSCEMIFHYGDSQFNPVAAGSFSETRDDHREKLIGNVIDKYFNSRDDKDRLLILNNDDKLFDFLKNGINELKKLGEVYVTDVLRDVTVSHTPSVTVGVSLKSDLLNLKISADGMDGEDLKQLLASYKQKKRFYKLKNGSFIDMEDEKETTALAPVAEMVDGLRIKDTSVSELSLPKNRAFFLANTIDADAENVTADADYKELIKSLDSDKFPEYEAPAGLNAQLRDYQLIGYRWMRGLAEHGFGGILADDMGLGKTIQVITLLLSAKGAGTSLICCPASLVYNWRCEFEKFAPDLKVVCVLGDAETRAGIIKDYESYDCLITSLDVLRRDIELYKNNHFKYQVIDEAQFIKNQNTQKAQSVKDIIADTKFALTGTPIENRLSELWSIFDYLMPGYLFSYQIFKIKYEQPIVKDNDEEILDRLRKLIRPFILRRLKKEVLKSLPDKIEEVVYSQLTGKQSDLYKAQAIELKEELESQSDENVRKQKLMILSKLTKLRQICCDPGLLFENYNGESAKLDACMDLVSQAVDGGHKILLFSQFTSMLNIIAEKLQEAAIPYFILTGETPLERRAEMVTLFNTDETKIFLISLRAGGTGLNLTAADIVIHYDPWWNVAAQNQATDRSHRIGQENNVNVYKLIAKDTIEDKILELQKNKQKLSDDLLNAESLSGDLDKNELIELLKA